VSRRVFGLPRIGTQASKCEPRLRLYVIMSPHTLRRRLQPATSRKFQTTDEPASIKIVARRVPSFSISIGDGRAALGDERSRRVGKNLSSTWPECFPRAVKVSRSSRPSLVPIRRSALAPGSRYSPSTSSGG